MSLPLWEYSTDEFPDAGSDVSERFPDWPRLRDSIRRHIVTADPRSTVEFEDWPQLRDNVRNYLGPLNVVYSWWWHNPSVEDRLVAADDGGCETLHVTVAMAYRTVVWRCPIRREEEPEVRQVLRECARWLAHRWSPQILGSEDL